MTTLSIQPPFPPFADRAGAPLQNGYIWIGTASLNPITNPIAVYWDAALTQAAAQPIRTQGGYPVNNGTPARLYVGSDYSILVQDTKGTLVYQAPNATERWSDVVVTGVDSSEVTFLQAGTGAQPRTVQSKLRDVVSVKDFGAVGDGVADDTAALKAAFDYAIPLALPVELQGVYFVTGPIQPYTSRASGSAHIVCKGNVVINVSASAPAFRDLFYLETSAANNCSITGGSLSVNCNNKAASAVTFRHNAAGPAGTVNIECPIEILNCYNNDAGATHENQAIAVFGDYKTVVINQPRVVGVSRLGSGGACKGISISEFSGVVTINQPYVSTVLTGGGSNDADGIATFGKAIGTTYNARAGVVLVNEPVLVDCQGRSFKSQCSDTTVLKPNVYRKNYVSISSSADFDFQFGNGSLIEPQYEYRLNGSTSPLGASHSCVSFQQLLDNVSMYGKSIGGVLKTEVLVPRYAIVVNQSGSLYSETEVADLRVVPIGALSTTAIQRAIIETDASTVVAKTAKTKFVVRNVSGPIQCYGVGYTGYASGSLAAKLSVEVTNCKNILSAGGSVYIFHALSGSTIAEVETFLFRNNFGFRDLLASGWTFTFNKLVPGCVFTVDIGSVVATGAPSWGASGLAVIECIGCLFNDTDKAIRVTKDNATVSNTFFYTQDGGATWGTIK